MIVSHNIFSQYDRCTKYHVLRNIKNANNETNKKNPLIYCPLEITVFSPTDRISKTHKCHRCYKNPIYQYITIQ